MLLQFTNLQYSSDCSKEKTLFWFLVFSFSFWFQFVQRIEQIFFFFSLEQPEEMSQIRELEEQVETLKTETRNRLLQNIDKKYGELGNLRSLHEREIETMTRQIDLLQEQLEETMKSR